MTTSGCASGWPMRSTRRCGAEAEPPLPRDGQAPSRASRPSGSRRACWCPTRRRRRTTVVEVNARDRPGLLARLAHVIHAAGHQLHSAHIATYGERAVDVFYLTVGRRQEAERGRGRSSCAPSLARGRGGRPERKRKGPAERRGPSLIQVTVSPVPAPAAAAAEAVAEAAAGSVRRQDHRAVRAGLRRRRRRRRRRWRRRLLPRRRSAVPELAAQRQAEGPRLAKEGAEQLGRPPG